MQKQFSPFAAGKKVYASGSYAPSRGANKKNGYIQREIRRKNSKRAKRRAVPSKAVMQMAFKSKLRRMR